MWRILIGSPVKQKPLVLKYFLESLGALNIQDFTVNYFFIDDNEDEQSGRYLRDFLVEPKRKGIIKRVELGEGFLRDEVTHRWTDKLVWRVAAHKNIIIKYALDNDFDYLFLVDSDILLHPDTLVQLINTKKDIISEIFWTRWQPNTQELPQVWACDHYTLYEIAPGESVSREEILSRTQKWIANLRKPGIYKVGGLGACTLISRQVLEKGVDFSPLYNISFWGEDRHFCIRAVAKGFELFVDTNYPAFHIYRENDFPRAHEFLLKLSISRDPKRQENSFDDQLLGVASNALKVYGTTEYYKQDLKAGLELFSPKIRETIYQERIKFQKQIQDGSLITYVDIRDLQIKEIVNNQKASVLADITNFGVINNNNFNNQFRAYIKLDKNIDQWLVSSIDFQSEIMKRDKIDRNIFWNKRITKPEGNRITLAMTVCNEADRYLRLVLQQAKSIVDDAVIIDDGSTDGTPKLINEVLKDIPFKLIQNQKSLFRKNESELRQLLWYETIKTNPDWILCLDADEIFEDKAITKIREMVNQEDFDYYSFRLYDFWDEHHYREDPLWSAHYRYHIILVRYQPNFTYSWNSNPLHCGRFPFNVTLLPGLQSPLRIKHLGWINPYNRLKKYLRYKELDPEGKWGIKEQYESILTQFPRLVLWKE